MLSNIISLLDYANEISPLLGKRGKLYKLLQDLIVKAINLLSARSGAIYTKTGDRLVLLYSRTGEEEKKGYFFELSSSFDNESCEFPRTDLSTAVSRIWDVFPARPGGFENRAYYDSTGRSCLMPIFSDKDLVGAIQVIEMGKSPVNDAFCPEIILSFVSEQAAFAINIFILSEKMKMSNLEMIERLSRAAEFRDDDTGNHIKRISKYCLILSKSLGLSDMFIEALYHSSPLHDIGKIAVPDNILLKPGKLTADEWEIMKCHTVYGANILKGSSYDMIRMAETVAVTHHEKWDGSGYPNGIRGESIPLEGRVVALADAFDAMVSRRCYKNAYPVNRVFEIIRQDSGTHFDPTVVRAFFDSQVEILEVYEKYRDSISVTDSTVSP